MGSNKNNNLNKARAAKNDEFYTQLNDINNELRHYRNHFKDKVVFCNCDDPEWSNFWKYFTLNFDFFGMKKLIATHYVENGQSYKLEFLPGDKPSFLPSDTFRKTLLQGNGDFRSAECVEILKEADIVVTNPPFSLFREYVAQLMEYEKKFIVVGNMNAVTYKDVFQHIKSDTIWLGFNNGGRDMEFRLGTNTEGGTSVRTDSNGDRFMKVKARWFTNLDFPQRHEELILYKEYHGNEVEFPKYDNYDAINVDKTKDIPIDYDGVMGVPISFLDKYCPDQFEIIGSYNNGEHGEVLGATKVKAKTKSGEINWNGPVINGRPLYKRIIIRRRVSS